MPAVKVVIVEVLALPPGFNETPLASVVLVVVSMNVTVPVGVPALPVTCAEKVTPAPTVDGFNELERLVVDGLKICSVPLPVDEDVLLPTVNVFVPVGVAIVVVIVNVEMKGPPPFIGTGFGEKLPLVPTGKPVIDKVAAGD